MKILKKRGTATMIDLWVFGSILALLNMYVLDYIPGENKIILLMLAFPACDALFGNASLGKKLLGLKIYDKFWRKPSLKVLYVRKFVTNIWGSKLFMSAAMSDKNFLPVFDLEREKCGTYVVDKEMYEEFNRKALEKGGNYTDNMCALFAAYLVENYRKDD